jgi:23S rRNA (adenine2503-C2)-methyltransferase
MGFVRNLTAGEIVGQLIYLRDMLGPDSFTNVVFMGMGEPLLNFDYLASSLQIMTSGQGFGISSKRIVVSTCGITPGIMRLTESPIKPRLALSLNAATQDKRSRLMPVAEKYSLGELMAAIRHYAAETGLPITFEYVLFHGINDTREDIEALAGLVDNMPCKINVLSYNPIPGLQFKRPTDRQVDWFGRELSSKVSGVTVRRSRGRDIAAACGQLATLIRK